MPKKKASNFKLLEYLKIIDLFRLKIIRYLIIGFSGFCIQVSINILLIKKFSFEFSFALLTGMIFGSIWNFYFYNIFVFKKYRLIGIQLLKGLIKYFFTTFFSLIQNYLIVLILFNFTKINSLISQCVGIIFSIIFNYLIYNKFIWKITK